MRPIHYDLISINQEIEDQNKLSVISSEELRFLFDALTASVERLERLVWTEAQREAHRQYIAEYKADKDILDMGVES